MNKRPVMLGIVGDSAAGKTTLSAGLTRVLGAERVTHICTDDYHKYDRAERARLGITPLHPDCNYIDILEQHLERARNGQPILKPVYDHRTGALVRPEYIQPREFVVVEGLLGFHTPAMRNLYDIKVFLDPPEEARRVWKLKRDTTKRGYTPEQVFLELEKREADSSQFIRPQREFADMVVQFYRASAANSEPSDSHLNVKLVLRPTIPHPDLSHLVDAEPSRASGVRIQLGRDCGRPVDFLEVDGNVNREHAAELEATIWKRLPNLRPLGADQFGDYSDGMEMRHSDPLALTQLLITYHLLRSYDGNATAFFRRPVNTFSQGVSLTRDVETLQR